jgi:anti-anti-sigma factor
MNHQNHLSGPQLPDRIVARTVVTVDGQRVGDEANRLAEQLSGNDSGPGVGVMLDLAAVNYVSSEDLGALIALHKQVQGTGGRLTLLNVRPLVSGVLSVTRLDTLFDVRQAG